MDPEVRATYERYASILRQKCRRMLPNAEEAEDVVQETFIRLMRTDARFAEPYQVLAWLYRTSTRLAVDHYRRNRARNLVLDHEGGEEVAGPADEMYGRLLWGAVAKRLSAADLELALLSRVDRLGQIEIARVLGISERTVRRRLVDLAKRIERVRRGLDA